MSVYYPSYTAKLGDDVKSWQEETQFVNQNPTTELAKPYGACCFTQAYTEHKILTMKVYRSYPNHA